jgi:hypothetical protein
MALLRRQPLFRHASFLFVTLALSFCFANAQIATEDNSSNSFVPSATESSSNALRFDVDLSTHEEPALPSMRAAEGSGGHQAGPYDSGTSHSILSHLTFEAGGGFNAPTSESSPYITWGGNLTLGGGYRFDRMLSMLVEYQFIHDKLPGRVIAQTGATGGYAHIWSFTVDPVVDLLPRSSHSLYVTGGGGFYRKVTNFTDPVPALFCTYYYCAIGTTNVVVGHFSSNQGGWSVGGGYSYRMGGMYGEGKMKLFAEARYLVALTPAVTTQPNGLGSVTVAEDTKVIPVTVGVRW